MFKSILCISFCGLTGEMCLSLPGRRQDHRGKDLEPGTVPGTQDGGERLSAKEGNGVSFFCSILKNNSRMAMK